MLSLVKKVSQVGLLFCATLCLCVLGFGQDDRGPAPPEGEGRQLFTAVCSQCHTLKSTLIMRDGRKGWENTVDRMVLYGAQLSPSEADRVINYLATQLGPGSLTKASDVNSPRPDHGNRTSSITLPQGLGKELVAARCSLCHGLENVVGAPRSKAEWQATAVNMRERGMDATPDEMQTIIFYLQANFSKSIRGQPRGDAR